MKVLVKSVYRLKNDIEKLITRHVSENNKAEVHFEYAYRRYKAIDWDTTTVLYYYLKTSNKDWDIIYYELPPRKYGAYNLGLLLGKLEGSTPKRRALNIDYQHKEVSIMSYGISDAVIKEGLR